VDDAVAMRVAERVAHLGEDRLRHRDRQRADVADHRVERAPAHVLHHEVQHVIAFFDRVDRNDVRVAQRGGGARLALEPLHHPLAHEQQGGRQHLDRHFAVEREVVAQVDRRHPAVPQLGEHLVFAECGLA